MSALLPGAESVFADIEEAHKILAPVMKAIASVVGDHCEVVLHDLSNDDLEHSVYAIVNGHVSGRAIGGPSTNLGVEVLRNPNADHNEFGYRGRTADGHDLISSSVYYRNHDGKIIAALCINLDLTPLQNAANAISQLLPSHREEESADPHELVGQDVASVLDEMITEAISLVGKPSQIMSKADRIEVLRSLETRGAFHIKRAADRVSTRLGVSRVTIYGYLDEIRRP